MFVKKISWILKCNVTLTLIRLGLIQVIHLRRVKCVKGWCCHRLTLTWQPLAAEPRPSTILHCCLHCRNKTTKDERIINLPHARAHAHTPLLVQDVYYSFSPDMLCALLSLNNAWNPVVHLELATGFIWIFLWVWRPCTLHTSVLSLSLPPFTIMTHTVSKKKNFLQTDLMQQALWPDFLHY